MKPETHGSIDLRDLEPCALCGKPLLPGNPHFYRITVQSMIFNARNLQSLGGLTQMLGGHMGIAAAMAPSTTVAEAPVPAEVLLVHQDCVLIERESIASLLAEIERRAEREEAEP